MQAWIQEVATEWEQRTLVRGVRNDSNDREPIPFLKVWHLLQRSMHHMAAAYVTSLEIWFSEVQHLPEGTDNPHTEAAQAAANKAWQQAPRPVTEAEPMPLFAWYIRLPSLLAAMTAHLESQLGISHSQVEKLQAFNSRATASSQKQLTEQLRAMWEDYHCLQSLHSVCAFLGPLSAMVQTMIAHHKNPYANQCLRQPVALPTLPTTPELHSAFNQGLQLLDVFRDKLQAAAERSVQLSAQLQAFHVGLTNKYPAAASQMEAQTARDYRKDTVLHVKAARTWLAVATELPLVRQSGSSTAQVLVSSAVNWGSLITVSQGFKRHETQEYDYLRELLYAVLCRPDLLCAFNSSSQLSVLVWGLLLVFYDIRAQKLHACGMPPELVETIMGCKEDVGAIYSRQSSAYSAQELSSSSSRTMTASSRGGASSTGGTSKKGKGGRGVKTGSGSGQGGKGAGSRSGVASSEGVQDGGVLNSTTSAGGGNGTASAQGSGEGSGQGDMQSLLDMMYGASIAREMQATGASKAAEGDNDDRAGCV